METSNEIREIRKRNGKIVRFSKSKIIEAIFKAAKAVGGSDRSEAEGLADKVIAVLETTFAGKLPSVEQVQDIVEKTLIENGHAKTAKAYILYRQQRTRLRE